MKHIVPIQALIKRINHKEWWHVQPQDLNAYQKRGKFYSSSFTEAEFYGRPGDSERVTVCRPLVGDETEIEVTLLGCCPSDGLDKLEGGMSVILARLELDARLKEAAVTRGYDAIVLMTPKAWQAFLQTGKSPRSIALNVFI